MTSKAAPLAILSLALVLTGALTGCVDRNAQKIAADTAKIVSDPVKSVRVETPRSETLEETIDVSGDVTTSQDVEASFRAGGRLASLNVSDGDQVVAGQVLATLDTSTLLPQVQQAQAQLQTANAQYQQALNNARLTPARSNAGIREAQAGLRSAQASLTKALRGARSEERAQAQARLNSARANVTLARTDLTRYQRLVKEGAIAQQRLDQAQNTFDTANAALNEATQALATLTNGSRTEDIAVAREAVRQAEGGLQTAKATRSLDSTLVDAANAARAQVEAAGAALRLAQQNLADTTLKAPISGRILGKPLQLGSVVQAGTQVVRIIGGGGVYFEGQVPSAQLAQVQSGQEVRTRVDAIPGKTFAGRIESIAPQGEETGRLFIARIVFASGAEGVRPGMFARGTVIIRRIPNALTLPTSAINTGEDGRYVVVNDNGTAKRVKVETGLVRGDRTQVTGLNANAQVVIQGASGLVEGTKIRVEKPGTAGTDAGNGAGNAGTGNAGGDAAGSSSSNAAASGGTRP